MLPTRIRTATDRSDLPEVDAEHPRSRINDAAVKGGDLLGAKCASVTDRSRRGLCLSSGSTDHLLHRPDDTPASGYRFCLLTKTKPSDSSTREDTRSAPIKAARTKPCMSGDIRRP